MDREKIFDEILILCDLANIYYENGRDTNKIFERIDEMKELYRRSLTIFTKNEIEEISNPNVKEIEGKEQTINEEFLEKYRALVYKVKNKFSLVLDEDLKQEIDIFILESFHKYNNQDIKFSTWLWNGAELFFKNKINTSKTQKADFSKFIHISLNYKFKDDKPLSEVIADENDDILTLLDREFIKYIMSKLNSFETDLLNANLKVIAFKDICEKYDMKKSTVSNKNNKFKDKLKILIESYNK